MQELEQSLNEFANIIDSDEVLLFERATFLVISHCERKQHRDIHRFEKVSNIIKQFKLSCRYVNNHILSKQSYCFFLIYCLFIFSRLAAQFHSMEVRNMNFACFIDVFTSNTYVMVIMSDPQIRKYIF